jgi:hypothetical protein
MSEAWRQAGSCVETDSPSYRAVRTATVGRPWHTIVGSSFRRTVMTESAQPGVTLEAIVKSILGWLDLPSREEIEKINTRLDRLEKKVLKRKSRSPVRAPSSGSRERKRRSSASDVVLEAIANHPEGVAFKTIQTETGYTEKKLRNIVFRLDKLNRIVREKRGVYRRV